MNTHTAAETGTSREPLPVTHNQDLHPGQDVVDYIKTYARQKPEVAALWCFGLGFIVGWKLKPW